jgi:hypothetical protein
MGIDEHLRIDRVEGPAGEPRTAPASGDNAEFRRLLERLENVARKPSTDDVEDIDKLRDAVRRADDDFAAVMDLRNQLEKAYRDSRP